MDEMENEIQEARQKSFSYDYVHLFPHEQIDAHQQPTWEVSFVASGSGIRLIGDTSEPFYPEEVVLIPPGIPHCWYFNGDDTDADGKIKNITVTFSDTFLNNCQQSFPELFPFVEQVKSIREAVKYDKRTAGRIASLLGEMRSQDAVGQLSSMINMLFLLSHVAGIQTVGRCAKTDKQQERLNRIRVYVSCNLSRDISLDDIVRHVGMNKSAFCTFFKQATGKTFIAYLNECRIEQACRLLREKNNPVSEICYAVGFTDIPYFNRLFKKSKGCAPSAYRACRT